jgi:hypothetical protein
MASCHPFLVKTNSGSSSIVVDQDGLTVISNLALVDEKTGNKWLVKVYDGELLIEPLDTQDKRDFKIKKILNEK